MRFPRKALLPVLALASLPAFSGECPSPGPQPLSLPDVVNIALCNNPQSHSAWLSVEQKRVQVDTTRADYYPQLTASATQSRYFGDSASAGHQDQTAAQLSLNWLLYDFGAREANVNNAQALLKAAEASRDGTALSVYMQAVEAYYQWFAARSTRDAATDAVKAAEETLKAAERRLSLGNATREDVLQARTSLSQARLSLIRAEGDLANATGAVSIALGLKANASLPLKEPARARPDGATPPQLETLLNEAEQKRPDLVAQSARVLAAQAEADRVRGAGLPTLSFFAKDQITQDSSNSSNGGSFGLSLSWSVFSGFRDRNNTRSAEYQIDIEKNEEERLRQAASQEIWQAWQNLKTTSATITATDDLADSSSEAYKGALARYQAGLGTLLNVLDSQSKLASARQQQASALYDWQIARIRLARVVGSLNLTSLEPEPASKAQSITGTITP